VGAARGRGQCVGGGMSRRLRIINDWERRADAARYCVKTLAQHCEVSVRTLRRFLCEKFGICPRQWMLELRMQRAAERLSEGARVKEAADGARYDDTSQFSRAFKAFHGCAPSEYVKRPGPTEN